MATTKQIVDNQIKYASEIKEWVKTQIIETREELCSIKANDDFVKKEKEKWLKRLKKVNIKKAIQPFIFGSKRWGRKFYIWWDAELGEAQIRKYDKK